MHEPVIQQVPSEQPVRERNLAVAAVPAAALVLMLWCIYFLDLTFELGLYRFGILPRELKGLLGIFTSPLIHGDFEHLLNNSIPLLVLGWALQYFFPQLTFRVFFGSWIVSGFWVWLSARGNYHIGASGVVYGLAAFLFTSGLLRKQRTQMGLSLLVVFLYGGLLWGMFPIIPRISWESHFWGAAAGVAMAFLYRKEESAVREPRPIVWEDDDDQEPDPAEPVQEMPAATPSAPSWNSTDTWSVRTTPNEKSRPPFG